MQNNIGQMMLAGTVLASCMAMVGCNEDKSSKAVEKVAVPAVVAASSGLQQGVCETSNWKEAAEICKDGDVVSVLFRSWGNEHLPLIAASAVCDMRYQIVSNNSGVVCVFSGERYRKMIEEGKQAAKKQAEEEKKNETSATKPVDPSPSSPK